MSTPFFSNCFFIKHNTTIRLHKGVLGLLMLLVLAGCDANTDDDEPESRRGARYCEILLLYFEGATINAEVWGTQGLNDCPEESWDAIEPDSIMVAYEANAINMNGPRFFLADEGGLVSLPDTTQRQYGDLDMQLVATITESIGGRQQVDPYTASIVMRDTEFTFWAGSEVYELVAEDSSVYVMQSYSNVLDENLIEADLPGLGSRLTLPEGWSYQSRILEEPLVIRSINEAVVLKDDLDNAYTQYIEGTDPDPEEESDAEILTTADGVQFVRTPEERFIGLPGFPYEARYLDIDGLRQGYVEAGPATGEVVLLLHGQPSWSYLYRKMIPVLADAGYRVIAMDHIGMGFSDKPIDIDYYTYLGHVDRLEKFIQGLGLQNITLFVQDWGSLIGLKVAGDNPDWFARIGVGDGSLPVIPAGAVPFPPVENPNELDDTLVSPYALIPAQQTPFYDGCDLIFEGDGSFNFGDWIEYALKSPSFLPSETLEGLTYFDLPTEEEMAYDAPFPERIYMGGPRTFPSLINQIPGQTQAAWEGLMAYENPFITIWASNDPGNLGGCEVQQNFIDNVPGAAGQDHVRLPESSHFLQDDQGEEIARRLVEFMGANPL